MNFDIKNLNQNLCHIRAHFSFAAKAFLVFELKYSKYIPFYSKNTHVFKPTYIDNEMLT